MSVQIVVPTLGESVTEATVAQWLKKPGEAVAADEPVVELETDKVTLEVNAPEAGTMGEIFVQEGDTVEVGAVLGNLGDGQAAPAAKAAAPVTPRSDSTAAAAPPTAAPPTAAAPAPAASGGGVDVVVPVLGESVTEATVAQWLKKAGDTVQVDEALVELETDKVTLEVNAAEGGTLTDLRVSEGDTVAVGAVLAVIATGAGGAAAGSSASSSAAAPAAAPPAEGAAAQPAAATSGAEPMVMPAAAKMIADNGLDARQITGTGKGGRILKEDVQRHLQGGGAAAPAATAARAPTAAQPAADGAMTLTIPAFERPTTAERPKKDREERVRMSKLRKTIASRLKQAQNTAAMLTTFNEVDMTNVMAVRSQYKDSFEKKHGVRLGFMSFFTKACVQALQELPAVNAEIDGDELVYKNYYDVGMAVGTPQGLVVPVVRDCDSKSFAEVEKTINDLGKRARDGKLSMAELTGGTFTITNGGVYGSLMSTPILNPPQSAILGMHKIQQRPMVMAGGKIEARPMMYLALSYDHRIIDGREAVTFLVRVKEAIEDPQRLLLDV